MSKWTPSDVIMALFVIGMFTVIITLALNI